MIGEVLARGVTNPNRRPPALSSCRGGVTRRAGPIRSFHYSPSCSLATMGAPKPQAAGMAQPARVYGEQRYGAALLHVVTFARATARASTLLQLTVDLKGALVFEIDSRLVPN